MKRFACVFTFLFITGSGYAQEHATLGNQFESLSWLVGTWDRTNGRPGETSFDEWTRTSEISYTGRGVTIVGSDTVFVENLELRQTSDAIYYVADTPGNAAPVLFRMTAVTDTSFIADNPDHDFPKRFVYTTTGDFLEAVISGGDQYVSFTFRRRETE